jgi:hypothetical protein
MNLIAIEEGVEATPSQLGVRRRSTPLLGVGVSPFLAIARLLEGGEIII